jgi:hypothetical protein
MHHLKTELSDWSDAQARALNESIEFGILYTAAPLPHSLKKYQHLKDTMDEVMVMRHAINALSDDMKEFEEELADDPEWVAHKNLLFR